MEFSEYIRAGWFLCAIDSGKKAPTYPRWNENPIEAEVADVSAGAGLLHVQSRTCALDIDALEPAKIWLRERNVDLSALLSARNAVRIDSGRSGRAKLLYRLGTPLRTFKPAGHGLELRCATVGGKSVQDVLPPSVHPDTHRPYRWLYPEPLIGDWHSLPAIPAALLAAWRGLLAENPATPAEIASETQVDLSKLHKWLKTQDPNAGYEDGWLKTGMKLHDATGGAEEGLVLWEEWSNKATRLKEGRPVQEGKNCRSHWVSFSSVPGKVVATLNHEIPADADEFETIVETPEEAVANADKSKAVENKLKGIERKAARAALEERLVYVRSSERYFDTKYHKLMGSDSAIEHEFTSMMPKRNGARINPVRELKQSTTKKIVTGLGFHPGEGAIFTYGKDEFANSYRDRLPKPLKPTALELEKIEWLFNRLDDEPYKCWLKQYYAHVVQRPAVKIKTAPLIWSETQRNGKSTLVWSIPRLLVGGYSAEVDYAGLKSDFNDYLQGAWHVNLTEFRASTHGERSTINNKIKAYIADDQVALHPKGKTLYTMPNHFFVTASSNHGDAAEIDSTDERWGVCEMDRPKYSHDEIQWIYIDFLNSSRAAAVLRHYFLNIDIKGFNPNGSPPMTRAKKEMADASMAPEVELVQTMFEERTGIFNRDVVQTSELAEYMRQRFRWINNTHIGRMLKRAPFNGVSKVLRVGKRLIRVTIVRNHDRWEHTPHRKIMAHINDEFDEIDAEVDIMD